MIARSVCLGVHWREGEAYKTSLHGDEGWSLAPISPFLELLVFSLRYSKVVDQVENVFLISALEIISDSPLSLHDL
jgi:hypothetical protein